MPVLRLGAKRLIVLSGLVVAALTSPAACSSNSATPAPVPGNDASTAPETGGPPVVTNGPVARFVLGAGTTAPNYLDVPFPSDAYISNGTVLATIPGLDNAIPNDTKYIDYGLSYLNGFSRVALAMFAVDDPGVDGGAFPVASALIDPTTLPVAETDCQKATSSVYLVDLAPNATTPILPCRAAFHDDRPRSQTTNPVVVVGPPRGYVLQEGHQYAVVLTSRVKDTSGHAVAASTDFAAVASGKAPGTIGAAYVTAFTAASGVLKASLAGDGAAIVALAPFTTMKKSNELFALRDALEAAPASKLAWDADAMAPMSNARFAAVIQPANVDAGSNGDAGGPDDGGSTDASAVDAATPSDGGASLPPGFTASLDDWLGATSAKLPDGTDDPDTQLAPRAHDKIAAVGSAVFSATSYLQVKSNGYVDLANGTFAYDDAGAPIAQANVPIWITFVVPKAPPPSAAGYPTVIVQHGLDGSREYILTIANTFAAQGWLVAGIDSVTFGARASEPTFQVDKVTNFGGTGTSATYPGPDGFADEINGQTNGSSDLFGGLQSIAAIRDQFRQAGFDTAQVVKLLRSKPDLSPLDTGNGNGAPQIDPSKIVYLGDSLGAMEGTIAAAIEPNVKAWFLNVNAGSLFPDLAAHSPAIGALLAEAAGFNFGIAGDTYSWSHPLLQVLQNIIEPGDPVIYAQYLSLSPQPLAGTATSRRNAVQTEVIWDDVVTDEANEAISRAAGWGHAVPNVGSNADITDLSNIANNPRATPFVNVSPDDAGTFHDTPFSGSTGIVIQVGPGQHGEDLVSSLGELDFQIPFSPPFTKLAAPIVFNEEYRNLQNVAVSFFRDAFQGNVPRVIGPTVDGGFQAPVRISEDGGT